MIVDDEKEAANEIGRAAALDRRTIRETFERLFSAERMAEDYIALYRRLSIHDPRLRVRVSHEPDGERRRTAGCLRGTAYAVRPYFPGAYPHTRT